MTSVNLAQYRGGFENKRERPGEVHVQADWHEEEDELAAFFERHQLTDYGTPWWAVGLLPLEPGTVEYQVRRDRQEGREWPRSANGGRGPGRPGEAVERAQIWKELVDDARKQWGGATPLHAIRQDPQACRRAALTDSRAFVQFIGLKDDDMRPWILKGFHAKAVNAMRRQPMACLLLPFMHGKSALSSIVVPLMDWCENPEATQIRIYHSRPLTLSWTRKLMYEVETSEQMHLLFPHVRRPEKGDPCEGIWGVQGFSIGGKRVVDPSFRPLTAGGSTVGVRADRVGADDWVNEFNSTSRVVQDKFYNYFKTGVLTMRRHREEWRSRYETKWGTAYIVGTLFDRQDINYRIFKEWNDSDRKRQEMKKLGTKAPKQHHTMRFSVYPRMRSRELGEVLWPEVRPLEYVKQLEVSLGRRAFSMRCENTVLDTTQVVFTTQMVMDAQQRGKDLSYGQIPNRPLRILIAYDPATGSTKKTKGCYPAAVVMGMDEQTSELHFIRYERLDHPSPRQIDILIDWARIYNCRIYVENNGVQQSYSDWIREKAPDVGVNTHFTTSIKHDPSDGVESMLPFFEAGRVVIYTGGVDERILREFTTELIEWPQSRTNDLMMASWIGLYNLKRKIAGAKVSANVQAPSYVHNRGFRQTVDLRKYR